MLPNSARLRGGTEAEDHAANSVRSARRLADHRRLLTIHNGGDEIRIKV
jgi:hypothetical protein